MPEPPKQQVKSLRDLFDLGAELGRGGMGIVYRAREKRGGRIVALKVLPQSLAKDATYRERFAREAMTIKNLKHPNIVQAYSAGQAGDHYYIAMEYVEGDTIAQRLKKQGQLPVWEALGIIRQVASALYYAHKRGIIHRDIKPHNIMLDTAGAVKIMDFGVAKIRGDFELFRPVEGTQSSTTFLTRGGQLGTLRYMSPEQIRGEPLDARSDIYSLGVTLYEMLAGESPFSTDDPMDLMYQITQVPFPDVRERNPAVPAEIVRLLGRMVAPSQGSRLRFCIDITSAVDDLVAERSLLTRLIRRTRIVLESVIQVSKAELREVNDLSASHYSNARAAIYEFIAASTDVLINIFAYIVLLVIASWISYIIYN